ncbi:MAG TPA: SDR family NAD(P)-dependent oxidoreductase [Alphaproteobacteria bacterium]|nr:SDR family NAD(P)-dependent oxidoreductase [Alphaproteobacteria bacterium]
MTKNVALIVGVGPGLGAALARRFAKGGVTVALAARRREQLAGLAEEIGGRAYACDVADEASVEELFGKVGRELGAPGIVIYNAGAYSPGGILEISPAEFERCWRVGCLGGFFVGQRAARSMVAEGRGTILFTGATASLRGGVGFANLAVGKFGLRALAQSMARELGPKGIHVAHVIIDGQIRSERYAHLEKERPADGLLDPAAIADTYWQLHTQPRSAWTLELDLRPWVERF